MFNSIDPDRATLEFSDRRSCSRLESKDLSACTKTHASMATCFFGGSEKANRLRLTRWICILFLLAFSTKSIGQELSPGAKIEHASVQFELVDFRRNRVDTATATYDRVVAADSTIENDCGKPNCQILIKFTTGIPDLVIEAHDIFIDTTSDINDDGIKELLVYHWWMEHNWATISVYTLTNNKWIELQRVKAFVSDDDGYKNRVQKIGKSYYLIGNTWNQNVSEIQRFKKRIRTR